MSNTNGHALPDAVLEGDGGIDFDAQVSRTEEEATEEDAAYEENGNYDADRARVAEWLDRRSRTTGAVADAGAAAAEQQAGGDASSTPYRLYPASHYYPGSGKPGSSMRDDCADMGF